MAVTKNKTKLLRLKDNDDITTGSLKDVANVLGVTDRMISNYLTQKKNKLPIYIRANSGGDSSFVKAHIFNMHDVHVWDLERQARDTYVGEGEDGEGENYNPKREQARLHKEKADNEAIKNSILRREYAQVALLEDSLSNIAGQVSSILGSIPMLLKRRFAWLTGKQVTLIQKEITRVQNVVASVRIRDEDVDDIFR